MGNDNPFFLTEFDRPRGIFTPRDRRFLAGELDEELTPNAERQKRYQLRERVIHALQDLQYLDRMQPRDLGQLVEAAVPEKDQRVAKQEQVRIRDGIRAVVRFTREAYHPNFFDEMVEYEREILAKLNHYEETGEYGEFDVEINVIQTDSTPIEELIETSPEESPLPPGMWQVVNLHKEREELDYELEDFGVTLTDHSPTEPELMERATEAIENLSDGEGAPREEVIEVLVGEHGATADEAEDAIEDVLMAGRGYEMDGRLKVI